MRVLSSPPALRGKSLLFLLLIPLAAMEALIYTRAGWWSWPAPSTRLWIAVVALLVAPLVYWLMRGRKWSLGVLGLLLSIWILVSALWAYRTQNPTLAFFAVGLTAVALAFVAIAREELGRPFLDGGIRWFQGLPQPMAGVFAELRWGEAAFHKVRVGRADEGGIFIFSRHAVASAEDLKGAAPWLRLKADGFEIESRVRLVSVSPDRRCVGFAFTGLSVEERVRLGELMGHLRGMGYAD